MSNTLKSIVLVDRDISAVLDSGDSYRLQRLTDLYNASYDKEAFVAILSTRLLVEHDRLALSKQDRRT